MKIFNFSKFLRIRWSTSLKFPFTISILKDKYCHIKITNLESNVYIRLRIKLNIKLNTKLNVELNM